MGPKKYASKLHKASIYMLTLIGLFLILAILNPTLLLADVYTGSGFFVGGNGYFVTNYHVIEDRNDLFIRDFKGKLLSASVIRVDKANDLALLKVNRGDKIHALAVVNSSNVRRGSSVVTVGYPNIDIQGLEPKATQGIVNSLSGLGDDPRVYQIDAPVQTGNSGGPLVDMSGNVVGVVVSKLNAKAVLLSSGDIPQNVNYAIKSNYLLELLNSVSDLKKTLMKPRPGDYPNVADLVAHVEMATGIVVSVSDERTPAVTNRDEGPQNNNHVPRSAENQKSEPAYIRVLRNIKNGNYFEQNVSVRAPGNIENGSVVPVEVTLSEPLTMGERLFIIVNDEYISHLIEPYGGVYVTALGVRVRVPVSGRIMGCVLDRSDNVRCGKASYTANKGYVMPSMVNSQPFDFKSIGSINGRSAQIKILATSAMYKNNLLQSIEMAFGAQGGVVVNMSDSAAMNPYVGVTANNNNFVVYRLVFKTASGETHLGSGTFR